MKDDELENFIYTDINQFIDERGNIHFSDNPKKMFGIILPSSYDPGFGHTLLWITFIVSICLFKEYTCFINDQNWAYGKWTDYFHPFWNENNLLYAKHLHTHVIGIGWSWTFTENSDLQKVYKKVYRSIHRPLKNYAEFSDIDLAVHIRAGDHFYQLSKDDYKSKIYSVIEKINAKKIFLMSDQFDIIDEIIHEIKQRDDSIEILTFCTPVFNGVPGSIRNSENISLMMKEIEIAKSAKFFLGSGSNISAAIDSLRDGYNVAYMHPYLFFKNTIEF